MSQINFAFDNAPATTKGRLKGRVDTSAFTEEQLARHNRKQATSRASTARGRARLRDPIDKPLQQKKVCIEAGPASVEPPVPAITGVYEQRPAGHILHEVLPDHDVSLDPRCPYAVWAGQYLTRLPFIPDPNNPDENALRVLSPHLERLVADARDARGSPYVDYYTYTEDIVGLGRKIRASMAKGNMAVVEGCPDVHRVELSEPDLLTHLHIQSQERFTAHDMLCRETNFETPYVETTLSGFIRSMKDPTAIRAILDSTTGAAVCPRLIGHVDEGYIAVDKMKGLFDSLPVDINSSRLWAIKHHPMYHTYVHHDASGTGTWTGICSGYKFWIKVVGKGEAACTSLDSLHEQYDGYIFQQKDLGGAWGFPYPSRCERYCIFAKPGDMVIQPSNDWHEVYTPQKSVTVGGHYFLYDTLHLTDAARFFDVQQPGTTNQHHSSSQLTLSAMVVYLTMRGPQTYRRKPLTSLCRMILRADLYLSHNEAGDLDLGASIAAFIKKKLPKDRHITWTANTGKKKGKKNIEAVPPQRIAQQAILMADILVIALHLDFSNGNHLFSTTPWTDPGEEVIIDEGVIKKMQDAVTRT